MDGDGEWWCGSDEADGVALYLLCMFDCASLKSGWSRPPSRMTEPACFR